MTQEFHISVTPVGQNDYLVRTEQVAPGVPLAEELVTWPIGDWLMAAGHLMNDPLNSVLQGDPFTSGGHESDIARNSVNLVALGQQFYNALFQGTLRDSWITAQGIAQNHQQVLRLRLGLKDTRLARLPWEVMHAGDRPLATGPYVAFSRFQSGISGASPLRSLRGATPTQNMPTPQEQGGVRVLMIIASPSDQVRLDLQKQEAIKLQAELHRQTSRLGESRNRFPEIELTVLDQPGREELTQALEQGRYHVLHYSGHSNLGANGGEIYLVSRRTGLTEILTGDDLAGLLVNNNIQMAVFNSCLGAYTAASNPSGDTGERNLAESLVKRGIRSVLAMSERIPDEVALTLTQLFYRNLSHGYPVDLCVSRVRQGLISAYGSHQMYWALPILYLQPEFDGFLSQETEVSASRESLNQYSSPLGATSTMYHGIPDDSEMPLGMEDMIPSGLTRDSSGLDWLGEDTWGDLVDEIEYDDPSYEEDSAIVSDLFRQLDNQKPATEPDHQIRENSLHQSQISEEMTSSEESADLWGEVPPPTPATPGNLEENRQNSNFSQSQPPPPRNRTRRRKLWPIVGVVGIGAIAAAIGLNWWWQNRPQALPKIPEIPTQSLPDSRPIQKQGNIDLGIEATGIVTATATEKLSQGDLQGGLLAVEELLNRGALAAAETSLKLIPSKQADDPSVNFYKGRLAWQSIQTGDNNYSVDDARRYWETAAKAKPESLLYNNALGFAYYTEGNLNRANDSWFKALNLALKEQNTKSTSRNTAVPQDALTSYAGLALGLYKSALSQPNGKQTQYLNEAIKLRQTVLKSDRENFQVDKLAKNWLWTEKAIEDWRSLLQKKGEEH
ncbi:heterocyst differentiation protein [Nostoc sp. 'Peltigera membranacea cyanobiont' 210A]|uniref:cell division protein HetF n=1 Tax=Nostoc sp. 'Peltigera membranacea cyanobiont' 210A TaxID=2014529 RepID=UPI000B95214C|nr:cell division protein HetF [Nostoc sp. 'Peltigera membranacea cyanobiont' 210A]OYD93348.1 heterocyst differentiation protein [Nostoc sp. 'Peltigera membranacea cyanobiont' 210A]